MASSQTWYVSNVIVYLGAGDAREESEQVGAYVMLVAVRRLEGKGHVVITDNFFTGVRVYMELLNQGFYATGTTKRGSAGFPPSLARFAKANHSERGTFVVKMHRSIKIVAIA